MKVFRIVGFGVAALIFTGGLSLAPVARAADDPKAANIDFVRVQGKAQLYVLHDAHDTTAPAQIVRQLQYICDSIKERVCPVFLWKEREYVAKSWPMTDREGDAVFISYIRNLNTGHESATVSYDNGKREEDLVFPKSVP